MAHFLGGLNEMKIAKIRKKFTRNQVGAVRPIERAMSYVLIVSLFLK